MKNNTFFAFLFGIFFFAPMVQAMNEVEIDKNKLNQFIEVISYFSSNNIEYDNIIALNSDNKLILNPQNFKTINTQFKKQIIPMVNNLTAKFPNQKTIEDLYTLYITNTSLNTLLIQQNKNQNVIHKTIFNFIMYYTNYTVTRNEKNIYSKTWVTKIDQDFPSTLSSHSKNPTDDSKDLIPSSLDWKGICILTEPHSAAFLAAVMALGKAENILNKKLPISHKNIRKQVAHSLCTGFYANGIRSLFGLKINKLKQNGLLHISACSLINSLLHYLAPIIEHKLQERRTAEANNNSSAIEHNKQEVLIQNNDNAVSDELNKNENDEEELSPEDFKKHVGIDVASGLITTVLLYFLPI